MEQLIPIASKLQDVLGALGQDTTLDLPQIVVVGGQSSGKSSVLEGIVGRSFLPRGHGIVTRRPLILQLYNTSNPHGNDHEKDDEDDDDPNNNNIVEKDDNKKQGASDGNDPVDEWGEFLHAPGGRFRNFVAIRKEIVRETDRLAGADGKNINPTPIHLKIYSPRVLNLTMVDLPGLTKVAVGDQPPDIEEQIRDLCFRYASNPNAIILAVTPASIDLANSDALQLARAVDPRGDRTVGVLTKLDLMDPGTDASEALRNNVVPLRRGYIGIVNRGQREIVSDMPVRDGIRREDNFFRTHSVYGRDRALQGRLGTKCLAQMLNSILMHHVKECLPELKGRISNMLVDIQSELDALGTPTSLQDDDSTGLSPMSSRAKLGGTLLGLLSKFAANFAAAIDGRSAAAVASSSPFSSAMSSSSAVARTSDGSIGRPSSATAAAAAVGGTSNPSELYGGARISFIFNEIFASSLMSIGAFDGLADEEIRTTIANANGTRPSLFVPEMSFDILVRRQISRLEQPGVQCVDLAYEELRRIASQCEPPELLRFPALRERMVEVVGGLLRRAVLPTQLMVGNLVKFELAYINTSHPDFIGGSRAVSGLMDRMNNANNSSTDNTTTALTPINGGGRPMVGVNGNDGQGPVPEAGGTTPLPPSSIGHYMDGMNGEDTIGNTITTTTNGPSNPSSSVVASAPSAQPASQGLQPSTQSPQYDSNPSSGSGGIMNFIFRGGGVSRSPMPANAETRGSISGGVSSPVGAPIAAPNSSTSHQYGSISNMITGRSSGMGGGGGVGGPPSIVQLPQVPDSMRHADAPPTEREQLETEIIKSLIGSYFGIVRKTFIDMVPKTIMYFLVNHVRDSVQNELVAELYRDAEIPTLMKEAEDVAERRKTCVEMRDLLLRALEIVAEVRDFNTFQ